MLKVKLEFEERFFRWSILQWRNELDSDFLLLKSIKDPYIMFFLERLKKLPENERWIFVKALTKWGRDKDTLIRCGEHLTEIDEKYIKSYLDMVHGFTSGIILTYEEKVKYAEEAIKKINRKKFKKYLTKALEPIFGNNYEPCGRGEWRYRTLVGPWKIFTYIDIGGTYHQLCYDHCISANDHTNFAESLSILRWLGLASQTNWIGLSDDDIESTANEFAKIVEHFIKAAPKLLEGLTPVLSKQTHR
jgi:hypothetical protein